VGGSGTRSTAELGGRHAHDAAEPPARHRPELALRRALHARGLRFLVDVPVPGCGRRRRADVLLRGARIALFVDGCFWHSCPEHLHVPKAHREWWTRKLASIVLRDRDTDARVSGAGWLPLRIWEHEPPGSAADRIVRVAAARARLPQP
jgi:DNA mismatch endonuclease (patch repair protein)